MSARSPLVAGLAALAAISNIGACGTARSAGSIQVAVVWSGAELDRFNTVIDEFEAGGNPRVDVISTGDDIDSFLQARHQAGNLPDVAVLPQPGLLSRYADACWLQPLDGIEDRYADFWADLGSRPPCDAADQSGADQLHLYGAWIKGSYKSLLWYRPGSVAGDLGPGATIPPTDWDGLQLLVEAVARRGGPAPMAIGAADSWVLTDWLDNLLVDRTDRELYYRLAASDTRAAGGDRVDSGWCQPEVLGALDDLARLWAVRDAFPGGGERAFLTQFDESVIQVAATGQAAMALGSEAVLALADEVVVATDGSQEEGLQSFEFPSRSGSPVKPALLGGDVAVVFSGSRQGASLISWLTQEDGFASWIAAGGYISPLRGAAGDYDPSVRSYASIVADPEQPGVEARFDLSDQLDGQVGESIGPVLQELFTSVAFGSSTGAGEAEAAAVAAASRLSGAAGGPPCEPG